MNEKNVILLHIKRQDIYICVAILLTPRHALKVAIHKNRFVIVESSKRELFESVNCVLNVKKI
jgi:hypothetical protein